MKWFAVKYIYQIISGEGNHRPQFDEQIRLLISESSSDALFKAQALARKFHQTFLNFRGEEVIWKFIGIADLHEIQDPHDGLEVASVIHEPANLKEFMDHTNKRKAFLTEVLYTVPID
ncbi:MAG: DUF4288 domain-containing protein [Bacteroidota bacterium]